MAARFTISNEVRQVLSQAEITPTSVRLRGTLERKLYVDVNKVLAGAGGKWDRKSGTHLFPSDPRELLGLAIDTGQAINKQQIYQSFYTPPELADRMAQMAELQPGMQVLEPSCGEGALILAALRVQPKLEITAYDIQAEAVRATIQTTNSRLSVHQADFLAVEPSPVFDRVLMNPPFTKGQDMQHVLHAWECLRPGGRLVAITSPAWQTLSTKAAEAFRLFASRGSVDLVPRGTFSESGTEVPTVLLKLDKPT